MSFDNLSYFRNSTTNPHSTVAAIPRRRYKPPLIESITHKYFESGHSQNKGDAMHSVIKHATNKAQYTPQPHYSSVWDAKKI